MLILSSRKELGYALATIMTGAMFIRVALHLTYVLTEASAVGASRGRIGCGPSG
jgi:hypothetical protein